jgi:hypothetical protein
MRITSPFPEDVLAVSVEPSAFSLPEGVAEQEAINIAENVRAQERESLLSQG